jgi:hypothetical protein
VDILAYTPEEFSDMLERSEFVAEAVARGKVILEAARTGGSPCRFFARADLEQATAMAEKVLGAVSEEIMT